MNNLLSSIAQEHKKSIIYKNNDFIITECLKGRKNIGKIKEINYKTGKFWFFIYVFPIKLGLKHEYYSKHEVIKTDVVKESSISMIIKKIDIQDYSQYIDMIIDKSEKQNKSKSIGNIINIFFTRLNYNSKEKTVSPLLEPLICCNKILNPDLQFKKCDICKLLYHVECGRSKVCDCGNSSLKKKVTTNNSTLDVFLSLKRENSHGKNENIEKSQIQIQNNESLVKVKPNETKLKDEKVINNVRLIKFKSTANHEIFKRRQHIKSLFEETLQNNQYINTNPHSLSHIIEDLIYRKYISQSKEEYIKKTKILLASLKNPDNKDLKHKLISKQLSPEEFISLSNEELMPSTIRLRRNEKKNKYEQENVIIQSNKESLTEAILTRDGEVVIIGENNNLNMDMSIKLNEDLIYNRPYEIKNVVNLLEEGNEEEYEDYDEESKYSKENQTIIINSSSNLVESKRKYSNSFFEIRDFFNKELDLLSEECRNEIFLIKKEILSNLNEI